MVEPVAAVSVVRAGENAHLVVEAVTEREVARRGVVVVARESHRARRQVHRRIELPGLGLVPLGALVQDRARVGGGLERIRVSTLEYGRARFMTLRCKT